MQEVAQRYVNNLGPVSSVMIAEELDLPVRMVRDAIYQLQKANLILEVNSDDDDDEKVSYYVPASDVRDTTISSVIRSVESAGEGAEILHTNVELQPIERIIEKFDKIISDSDSNKLLVDLPEPKLKKKLKKTDEKNSDNRKRKHSRSAC